MIQSPKHNLIHNTNPIAHNKRKPNNGPHRTQQINHFYPFTAKNMSGIGCEWETDFCKEALVVEDEYGVG